MKITFQELLDKFRKTHGNRYDYSITLSPEKVVHKINITCRVHGVFTQTANSHYMGNGCSKCARITQSRKSKISKEINRKNSKRNSNFKNLDYFTKKSKITHGDLYDYSDTVYYGAHTLLDVRCKIHGIYKIKPVKHYAGGGCQKCAIGKQTSKISDNWLNFIGIPSEYREYRLPVRKLRCVDGYDPNTNTVYQFHGDFFHGNPKVFNSDDINPKTKKSFGELYQKTIELDKEIESLGYKLIVMWEKDWEIYLRQRGIIKQIWG